MDRIPNVSGSLLIKPERLEIVKTSFWSRVDVRGPNECWPWLGAKTKSGHGLLYVSGAGDMKPAIRVSWALAHPGELMRWQCVICHECNNPPCVNPAHLRQDTAKSNAIDKMRSGEGPMLNAKLTIDQVRAIRASATTPKAVAEAAALYGLTAQHVRNIVARRYWAWVD